jgi:hypothetical protein
MESGGIQVLMTALPGQRVTKGAPPEDGSVLAYRSNGDECLFASWEDEDEERGKGMAWIPVGDFSPDPESIRPPDILEGTETEGAPIDDGSGTTEADPGHGPMGGKSGGRSGLRRRPTVEG